MELLTITEAAKLTRLSTAWWRTRIFRKEVRFLKVGRRVFIPRSTIDDLLNKSIVEPKHQGTELSTIHVSRAQGGRGND